MLSVLAGKYSSEVRPAFFLAILYMLVPCWAGVKILSQSHAPTSYTPNMVSSPPYTVCERLDQRLCVKSGNGGLPIMPALGRLSSRSARVSKLQGLKCGSTLA